MYHLRNVTEGVGYVTNQTGPTKCLCLLYTQLEITYKGFCACQELIRLNVPIIVTLSNVEFRAKNPYHGPNASRPAKFASTICKR